MKKKACSVCMENCRRLHGDVDPDADEDVDEEISPVDSSGPKSKENGASEPRQKEKVPTEAHPSFLKKMAEATMTSALQMPASFVKTSIAKIGTVVTLEGPGKGIWRVQTGFGKENHSLEFRDGWRKFVRDHMLQIGDQLTLTLTADSYFKVVVYDESGSEKISATDATNSPLLLHQWNGDGEEVGAAAQVRQKPVSRPKQKVRRKLRTEGAVQPVKTVPLVLHSSESSELRNSHSPEKEIKSKETASVQNSQDEPDTDDNHLELLPPHVILDGHVRSQRRSVSAEEKERALKAAKALPITNPKLVVVMSKAYVYRGFWMALSRPFARAHMPHVTRDVTLVNKAGRKWTVKWLYKGGCSSGFSGGWRGFSLDHRLEEFDVCVLEVVDEKNFIILVHIFRVLGASQEDAGDYRPTPGRARNASLLKRKVSLVDSPSYDPSLSPDPRSTKKCLQNGAYGSAVGCSKVENLDVSQWQTPPKVELPSCSKRAPKNDAKVSLDLVPDENLRGTHKEKKVKSSPTTSDEVYAQYANFATPPPGDAENVGKVADLEVHPLNSIQAATENFEASRENLLKLGKELVGNQTAAKASSGPPSSSHSRGHEQMQVGSPIQVTDLNG